MIGIKNIDSIIGLHYENCMLLQHGNINELDATGIMYVVLVMNVCH